MHSRREFLKCSTAFVGATACSGSKDTAVPSISERSPEPLPWVPEGEVDWSIFPFGVLVGDVGSQSAVVQVHAELETSIIQWVLVVGQAEEWIEAQAGECSTGDIHPKTTRIELDGLESDQVYSIVLKRADQPLQRSSVTRFRTALADQDWRIVKFAVTSCFGGNRPFPSLSHVADEKVDFVCYLGDLVYADGSATEDEYWWHWKRTLSQSGMRALNASASMIATWDDHEFTNNYNPAETPQAELIYQMGLRNFRRAIPQRVESNDGIWRALNYGDVLDVFVLDCRTERSTEQYVSPQQLDWLKQSLTASTARFKILLNSVPISDFTDLIGEIEAVDRWQGYAAQRTELLSHIEENQITGVLWLAGDFHFGMVAKVGRVGELGDGMYEVLCGPAGSFINIMGELLIPSEQFQLPVAEWNTTVFTCNPEQGSVTVSFIGDEGQEHATKTLQL